MKNDMPLDYAVFQLSPKHSRCELFVSSNGNTEKLASGLVKPFVTHLKVAEEQVARAVHSIKLEVQRHKNAETWFTKGTLERFVRFVSTPEVLEMVNTFDAEMSQLEAAQRIYSQGGRDQLSDALGGDAPGVVAGADATKKELLRAIDVRLTAVKQDLTTSLAHASAAGFNPDTVSELQLFSDCFGAHRLNEACNRFISLCERRPDLTNPWKPGVEEQVVRASWGSDMSIDPNSSVCAQPTVQGENKEEDKKEEPTTESSTSQPSQPARRLSVQDRINLFENKQKENSGGKPVAVGKSVELRRLSSDVSSVPAVERAVLRRWSAASDMSIDLGNDNKDNNYSKDQQGLNGKASSVKAEAMRVSGFKDQDELQTHVGGFLGKDEEVGLKGKVNSKDQVGSQASLRTLTGRGELASVDPEVREEKLVGILGGDEKSSAGKGHGVFEGKLRGYSDGGESVGVNNQSGLHIQIRSSIGRVADVDSGSRVQDVKTRDQPPSQSRLRGSQTHIRSLSGQLEGGFGMKVREGSYKEIGGDQSASQPRWRSATSEVEQVRKDVVVSVKEPTKVEDLEVPRMKVQKPFSAGPEHIVKLQGRRDETGSTYGSNKPVFHGKKVSESRESFGTVSAPSVEQVQRRQSKGNQELNDELKMKAYELEKLFAEHKLRVPGDQSGFSSRSKPAELQVEQAINSQYRKPTAVEISPAQVQDKKTVVEPIVNASDNVKFSTPPPMKTVDQNYGSSLRHNFSELSFSDDARGKFYERYMQKRDAKLREEWGTKRSEKEAKLKAMQDSLERSSAEMKAKFSGSADRLDSVSSARRRAEKLRTYYARSGIKREQHLVDSLQSEEDEDPSDILEKKYYKQDRSLGEVALVDGASRSSLNKKLVLNRNLSSSTPRTTAAPAPRSSVKISNQSSGRRRIQSENPLALSVPNFSDFRKENTKPSSGFCKTANRTQVRSYPHSKSTTEEIPLAKEEKPRQSQSLRKSSASPAEVKDLPTLNSDDVVLAPLKFDKEQTEQGPYEKFSKNVESKPFLRKGNGIGPGAETTIAKLKGSVANEALENEEAFEEYPFEAEDSINEAKKEDEEELETTEIEDSANTKNGKLGLGLESDKMSDSENSDSLRSLSQVDPSSVAELPASVPSTLNTVGSLQDSPGESPVSWNSRMHNPFSYPHGISDIDASVDSPIGSPALWNSHSLAHADTDTARMRKKWGSGQKPIIVSNSSHNQPRKDVTKGFKRLLKFGRKSRGTESLVDWISATTSEGDDDAEDGRDLANRTAEDLRKSRMGFLLSHPSDYGFNESELFNEHDQAIHSSIPAPPANFKPRDDHMSGSSIKAPRSFFSLSTFRSKGSESKLR
ncbi:uncharacterized protein LOC110633425 isoform X2 [Hevea brasiliensis]|uniref:uncharacterized protein LOC110633425 isoform X2 n=1 Tax=Hevea brasiliensis TaxID=3981 RepID=UPI0025FC5190|nr:uncharacterized protein LOC110633425 isoform X2 [Hevea brasiliensis]